MNEYFEWLQSKAQFAFQVFGILTMASFLAMLWIVDLANHGQFIGDGWTMLAVLLLTFTIFTACLYALLKIALASSAIESEQRLWAKAQKKQK